MNYKKVIAGKVKKASEWDYYREIEMLLEEQHDISEEEFISKGLKLLGKTREEVVAEIEAFFERTNQKPLSDYQEDAISQHIYEELSHKAKNSGLHDNDDLSLQEIHNLPT